ncbi:hypothetical protein [uncultured Sphingomonas sp.]|uniref:hypothetical protein n=1 Tax=uncultured Sphingomonas sp. TaxID=158754 RepID=UPI00262F3052|nr:hypothetical protein [uncultured Sphingomonas sp.]
MIAALLIGLATAGPAAVGPVAPVEADGHQTVYLGWDARIKACSARVDGIPTGDPATDAGKTALLGALSDRQRAVQLQGLTGIPYSCVDTVVSAIRQSGRAVKVGFLSEPSAR